MRYRARRHRVLPLTALAGSAIAVGIWLLAASASPRHSVHIAARSAPRPHAIHAPRSTATPLPGLHVPRHPTQPQHQTPAPKTSPPALVRLPGITLGSHCTMPNFPARTGDGTAVVCTAGKWQRK